MAASWRPLGALGELLGSLGGLLGFFWQPLGALGELLESLGSLLATSWGSLGTSWLAWKRKSDPGSSGNTIFEAPRRPPWRENGPGSSGSRIFRALLGRSWAALELPGGWYIFIFGGTASVANLGGSGPPPKALAIAKAIQ